MLAVPLAAALDLALMKPQTSWTMPFMGFEVVLLHADRLSLFMGYIFVLIGFLGILYSLKVEDAWHNFSAFMYVGSSLGAVFAGDLFSFIFFWEITAIASTLLIMSGRNEKAIGAGFRYFIFHVFGDVLLLAGVILHILTTGSMKVGAFEPGLAFNLAVIGIGVNAAFVLLHTWLPDAYSSAPFTGSIFLCVYTTKTAVYALGRICPGTEAVAYMGGLMALFGVSYAVMQNNARKLLSYHVMSQVGYMVAGVGIGTSMALNGAFFHVFNHILYKALLFMCVGSVLYITGREELTSLGGLARKMPVTTAAIVVAAFSISGVPLFNGFVSKGLVVHSSEPMFLLFVMLELAAVGTFLSFLKLLYFGFFRENPEIEAREVPLNMRAAMSATAFLCVLIGIYPALIVRVLPFPVEDYHFYSFGHVFGSVQILGVTALIFWAARRYYSPHHLVTRDFDSIYIAGAMAVGKVADWFVSFEAFAMDRVIDRLPGTVRRVSDGFIQFERKVLDGSVGKVAPTVQKVGGEGAVAFERKVIDGSSDTAPRIAGGVGEGSVVIDKRAVEGIVNKVGVTAARIGGRFRRAATGMIGDYTTGIAVGVVALIIITILVK